MWLESIELRVYKSCMRRLARMDGKKSGMNGQGVLFTSSKVKTVSMSTTRITGANRDIFG